MNKLQLVSIKTKKARITETLPKSLENCLVRLLEIREERNKHCTLVYNNIKFPNPELFADTSKLWESPELIFQCTQLFQ